MSKIGKMPITIPEGVEVIINKEDKNVKVKSSKGELDIELFDGINVELKDNVVTVSVEDENSTMLLPFWGTQRALIQNAVLGVSEGYEKVLEIIGVGYRVQKEGENLKLAIGYSHPVYVYPPEGITLEVEGNTIIKVKGIDKQLVGQLAANIRAIRKPEPYKGKGIRYKDEHVRRKQGKSGKV